MKTILVVLTLMLIATPAYAYIDPGSGSAIMTATIGLFVALGVVMKTYRYKIKSLFIRKPQATVRKTDGK